MSYFPWSDEYSVHVRMIDNDHKDLVKTVNVLHEAISNGAPHDQISHIIASLAKYVDEHFAREEALMESYDYPALARHKRIHRQLARTVHAIRTIFNHEPNRIDPTKLLIFLRDWLVHHILKEDMQFVPYLLGEDPAESETGNGENANGADPADADNGPEPATAFDVEGAKSGNETVTLTVPAGKAAVLRRCARLLIEGGLDAIAIEDVVMPVGHMTYDEAVHVARSILH